MAQALVREWSHSTLTFQTHFTISPRLHPLIPNPLILTKTLTLLESPLSTVIPVKISKCHKYSRMVSVMISPRLHPLIPNPLILLKTLKVLESPLPKITAVKTLKHTHSFKRYRTLLRLFVLLSNLFSISFLVPVKLRN